MLLENRAAGRTHSVTRGVHIFEKPCCREIRAMEGRVMRGLPVIDLISCCIKLISLVVISCIDNIKEKMTIIFNILDNTTELCLTIFGSGRATLECIRTSLSKM